ncbi:hypothetical protein CHF27_005885 [Romboutsia maritimum]|uniref:Lipoprotein n=1 Tax=Romboutsia maritimum TaxID=2020948 RepID=A0A255IJC7_9FIRM|nr:hypothetical protein [Romboutsia maritimum]RDY23880.1 hypothetical protein CHF27_005885 [Romboutsia maritimum]
MNKNKIVTIGLALALTIGVVGCNKEKTQKEVPKNTVQEENARPNDEYSTNFSKYYNDYLVNLPDYNKYNDIESIKKTYETEKYPGNEKYVSDLKVAYQDSKQKIQSFIDSLKKDVKTDDKELKKTNDELISEGEKLIKNLDEKIKKLDQLPDDAMKKPKDEFIKLVNDTTKIENETENGFNKILNDIKNKLGIKDTNKK